MERINYDFADANKPALAYFDRPLKPMTKTAEVRLLAIKGIAQWEATKDATGNPDLQLDYFFVEMGYSLQVYDAAFWMLRGKKQ
jgi:hypothetical protein